MCIVSNMGDMYRDRWYPAVDPNTYPMPPMPQRAGSINTFVIQPPVTRAEFDALKAEVVEMKELLKAAKRMDELMGNADCEMADKVAVLRKVAELVGVDLDDVFGKA